MVSSSVDRRRRSRVVAARVSSIELLLDLVFVFTISQLAEILVVDPTWDALAQTAVLMAVIWWMYDAFAWLTNQARPDTTTERLLLIGAMAAFLVMSLAVPDAFGDSGVVFAVSYLVVVAIHAGVFISSGGPAAARAMRRVLLTNTAVGALLLAAAFVQGAADWVLFVAPFALFVVAGVISRRSGAFELGASHFVERHGLLMIIALGESIVSVGAGLAGHELDAAVIIGAIATVAVVATLWWSYFAGTDDERATETLGAAPAAERTSVALDRVLRRPPGDAARARRAGRRAAPRAGGHAGAAAAPGGLVDGGRGGRIPRRQRRVPPRARPGAVAWPAGGRRVLRRQRAGRTRRTDRGAARRARRRAGDGARARGSPLVASAAVAELLTDDPERAADCLAAGGLAVLPTETVYGLGADAEQPGAVGRIFTVKGRPAGHPLIVHLPAAEALDDWARAVPAFARDLATTCWPGPLTLLLARSGRVSDAITGGRDSVGLRVPAHPLTATVLGLLSERAGRSAGVAAPSANRFGSVSPTTAAHVVADLGRRLDAGRDVVLDGGPSGVGVESTIVDCTADPPQLLRPGAITATEVEAILGGPLAAAAGPSRAAGMLRAHYAPRARVHLADSEATAARDRRGPRRRRRPPGGHRRQRPRHLRPVALRVAPRRSTIAATPTWWRCSRRHPGSGSPSAYATHQAAAAQTGRGSVNNTYRFPTAWLTLRRR